MAPAPSRQHAQRLIGLFLLTMAVAHGVIFWQQRVWVGRGYGDFSAFYTAGLLERRGAGHFLYDPHAQWQVQQEFASQVTIRKGPMPFIRPPFEALLFVPLTYFVYPVALAIWTSLKLAALGLAVRILPRSAPFTPVYPAWLTFLLSLGLFPVFLDFLQGQDTVLLL